MADEGNKGSDFKVEDRRTVSGRGGKEPEPPAAGEPSPGKVPEGGADAGDEPSAKSRGTQGRGSGGRGIPRVDFSTFVFSLFSSALIQLGDMADPVTGERAEERNLEAVSQTIDLLDLMKEKTEGNLTGDESSLLKESTAQLKLKYFNAVKGKG